VFAHYDSEIREQLTTPHASEPLFEVPLGPEEGVGVPRAKVDKTFRAYDQQSALPVCRHRSTTGCLRATSLRVRLRACRGGARISSRSSPPTPRCAVTPPYDPRLMVKLLGLWLPRRRSLLEGESRRPAVTRSLSGSFRPMRRPDFRSIARFRRRHLEALRGMFLQSLKLCQAAGMVRPRARRPRRHQAPGERLAAKGR